MSAPDCEAKSAAGVEAKRAAVLEAQRAADKATYEASKPPYADTMDKTFATIDRKLGVKAMVLKAANLTAFQQLYRSTKDTDANYIIMLDMDFKFSGDDVAAPAKLVAVPSLNIIYYINVLSGRRVVARQTIGKRH